jgi:hypothetical protein
VALYDGVFESLHKIEQDTDTPPTRAEVLRIAHIKALMMIGQSIRETTFSHNPVDAPRGTLTPNSIGLPAFNLAAFRRA